MAASYDFDEEMKKWKVSDKAEFNSQYKDFDFTQFFSNTDGFKFTTYAAYSAEKK